MNAMAGGTNAILLLLLIMSLIVAAILTLIAARRRNYDFAKLIAGLAAAAGLIYAGGVVAVSATSTEQTLPLGETKWFCGFYLDCHLGISVEGAETAKAIPSGSGEVRANGIFHIVTLRLHNSARNPAIDMNLYQSVAKVVDASGREYSRSVAAEAALAKNGSIPSPLGAETRVTHDPVLARISFELPADALAPRLMVTEGWIVDRVIEFGLIGDENSIIHKKTLLALNASAEQASTTASR